jgi:hypothetical protein
MIGAVAASLLLAACGVGITGAPTDVTDVGVTLTGTVANTSAQTTTYWFNYGLSTTYGSTTPRTDLDATYANYGFPVTADVEGLTPGQTYHYQLCTTEADGNGDCGKDQTLTTTNGRDSVSGWGYTQVSPGFGFGAQVFATSGPDGAGPVAGQASVPYLDTLAEGPVTCLRVVGNRAAVGFMGVVVDGVPPVPELVYVEDNGPTGDRIGTGTIDAPATSCPDPTGPDADAALHTFASGPGFVVHDAGNT